MGGNNERKKAHFIRWEDVTKPKKVTGVGLVRLKDKNGALLCK